MKISLEQWRMFVATAQYGSFHQAAERLNKTQSAISHAIHKMEECLGQDLFAIEGRRATLTRMGQVIFPRARELIGQATHMERFCAGFDPSAEGEIALAVDIIFPSQILRDALAQYSLLYPNVSVRIQETALSGTSEVLEDGRAQIGIASHLPPRTVIEPLLAVHLVCVATASHPLHKRGQLTHEMLKEHRQVVLSDSGLRGVSSGWLGSRQRWTVSHLTTSLAFVIDGHGYAWLPEHSIRMEIASGRLKPLNLSAGRNRVVQLHIGYLETWAHSRQVLDLVAIFRDAVEEGELEATRAEGVSASCGGPISTLEDGTVSIAR
ncbi:LysR family transcriptional regulator [Methylocystis sp. MJC1]|uniref:LysR family transcriptional regulator n=1 Tax=Methylocystis sp. MJC1 TaxID=2654282 RepID=UPI0013EAE7C1|nr:LysR family transcriptional regulator [Methylocystis sp. MJC1]KAF2991185.1 HTH-type transcriptional activator CmpR [Methylocystis sp. MJC1]MBU6526270.1 LysR family transcriptional regulator [Methylocystis sp. MJC1]UZX12725.1 LysR family transcriptional regulator [Methylocystis sp. MJC1]